MGLFLDTNVFIGYIFEFDYWNKYASNILSKPYKKYWSNNVKKELRNKIRSLQYDYLRMSKILSNIIIYKK
jgi:hypothetical protein